MASALATQQHWRIQGVSVQGYGHLRDGVECQDAYRHTLVEDAGVHVLAVADGAGSRVRSAEGATLAVGLANSLFARRLSSTVAPRSADSWRAFLGGVYDEIVAAFLHATDRMGPNRGDFAATLTAVVLAHPYVGVVSIGDGLVVVRADDYNGTDGFHVVSSTVQTGEYVNETVFLTSAAARSQVIIDCLYDPQLTAVLLSTDGLVPAAILQQGRRRRPNRSFLEPVLGALDDPAGIARLLLEDRISALSADDKTLLMAVRQ